jgi:cephalosporin hydroxylase
MLPMNAAHLYGEGPLRAIEPFLKQYPEFEIDQSYCDYYGRNLTCNMNLYLHRAR